MALFKRTAKNTLTAIHRAIIWAQIPAIRWGFGTYKLIPVSTIGEQTREFASDLGGRWEVPDAAWVAQDLRDWIPNHLITKSGHDTSARFTPEDLDGMALSPASVVIYQMGLVVAAATSALILSSSNNSLGYLIGTGGLAALLYSPFHSLFGGSIRKAIAIGMAGLGVAALGFFNTLLKASPLAALTGMVASNPASSFNLVNFTLVNLAVLAPLIYVLLDNKKHVRQLYHQSKLYAGAQSIKRFLGKEIRLQQAVRAHKEREAGAFFIPFAYSLGAFPEVISPTVADPGLILGLSTKDTNLHMVITGATGKGKTGFLRHIIFSLARLKKYGLFIACGKGKLAYDVKNALDYVITPADPYNAFYGQTTQDIEASLEARYGTTDAKNKVFTQGALQFIRAALNLLDAIINHPLDLDLTRVNGQAIYWNPMGLITMSQLLQKGEFTQDLVETIHQLHYERIQNPTDALKASLDYVSHELPALPNDTRQSFLANVNQWLGEFTAIPEMAHWANATNPPAALEECFLSAKKIGVGFGDSQGKTGSLYLHFINRRFKQVTKQMDGKRKNECYFIFDECYALLSLNQSVPSFLDDDIYLAQGRSYGVHCIYAYQNDSQLLGLHPASVVDGFLGNFNSGVDLGSDDTATERRLVDRAGHAPRFAKNNLPAETIDFMSTYLNKANSPIYDLSNPFRNQMRGFLGFFGIKTGYLHKDTGLDSHPIVSRTVIGTQDPIPVLDKNTFSKYRVMPQVGFMYLQRAGLRRIDYGHMIGADENGNVYPLVDLLKEVDNIEQVEAITRTHAINGYISNGDTVSAAALVQSQETV